MSIKTLSLRACAFALFATLAVVATEPASAASAKVAGANSSTTDLSVARRHHVQRHSVRDAYGAYVAGAAAPAQTWNNYGNGVGDNSRNQTW